MLLETVVNCGVSSIMVILYFPHSLYIYQLEFFGVEGVDLSKIYSFI